VRHAGGVEEGGLRGRLELHEEEVQQVELVLRGLGVEAHDLAREALGGPRLHGDGAEAAAAGDEALREDGAQLAVGGERLRDERRPARGRQRTVGRGDGHRPRNVVPPATPARRGPASRAGVPAARAGAYT
jgi:hypothetical protein